MSAITYSVESYTSSNGMTDTVEYHFSDGERWVKTTTETLENMKWRRRSVIRRAEFPGDVERRTTVGALTAKLAASDGFTPLPTGNPEAAAAEALQEAAANHDDEDTFTARYGIVHADTDGRALRVIIHDGIAFLPSTLNDLAYAALAEWLGRDVRAVITLGHHGVTTDGHMAVQVSEDRTGLI